MAKDISHRISQKITEMAIDNEKADFLYVDITRKIIGAAFEVYKEFGYGFLEKVYENALLIELTDRNLKAESQKPIAVAYKGRAVGNYAADIVVEDKVLVELKAEKVYNQKHEAQLIH